MKKRTKKEDPKKHHPAQTGFAGGYGTFTVDLGSGVGIRWTTWKGVVVGGILSHPRQGGLRNRCDGGFSLRGNAFDAERKNRGREKVPDQWDFNGDFEKPDLNPSFLCHCGFHGWIRNGVWVPA